MRMEKSIIKPTLQNRHHFCKPQVNQWPVGRGSGRAWAWANLHYPARQDGSAGASPYPFLLPASSARRTVPNGWHLLIELLARLPHFSRTKAQETVSPFPSPRRRLRCHFGWRRIWRGWDGGLYRPGRETAREGVVMPGGREYSSTRKTLAGTPQSGVPAAIERRRHAAEYGLVL